MTEPPQDWWEQLGARGMAGAGAGIGLMLSLIVIAIAWLASSATRAVVAEAPAGPRAVASRPEAVESAGAPTVAAPAFASAPKPVETPSEPPRALPPEQGPSLATRQAVYTELHRVGMHALRDADRQFPLDAIPQGRDDLAEKYLLGHQAATRLSRRAGRLALGRKYGLAAAALDAIQREGNQEHWPVGED